MRVGHVLHSTIPLPHPREAHLWHIFLALLAMNGPLPAELKFRENTVYKVGKQKIIIFLFFGFSEFCRSSSYFSLIVISIIFYHVECGDGRQPRILIDNLQITRSKTHVPLPGLKQTWQSCVITFFALIRAFPFLRY